MGAGTRRGQLVRWAAGALSVGMVAGACTGGGGSLAGYYERDGAIGDRPVVELGDVVLASLTRLESCEETAEQLRGATVAAIDAGTFAFGGFGRDLGGVALGGFDDVGEEFTSGGNASADGSAPPAPTTPAEGRAQSESDGGGSAGSVGGPGADVFSGTNVQEVGVDEPDIVKTDGSVIYVLRDGAVRILDADDLSELAVIERPADDGEDGSTWFQDLLLDDDVLLVVGNHEGVVVADVEEPAAAVAPERWRSRSVLNRYDVSDPADPTLIDRTEVDGHVVSSRLIGGVARIVTSDSGAQGVPVPEPLAGEEFDTYQERMTDAVADAPAEAFLPTYTVTDADGEVMSQGAAVPCDQVYIPSYETGPSTLSVHTLDLDGAFSPADGVTVLAGGETVYASADTLYVATSRFSGGNVVFFDGGFGGGPAVAVDPAVGAPPDVLIDEVDAIAADEAAAASAADDPDDVTDITVEFPDPILPEPEPEPVPEPDPAPIVPPEPPTVTTEIHAFDIAGDDPADYLGSGQVTGTVLNQFSMSEHDDVLRIATTDEGWGGPESQSYVTTLRLVDDELTQIGQVGGLGKGERIYAVRFLGTTGYVVTFRQIDPLYTIDLSDPAEPSVLGELKITGFSAYLHPTAPGRLLGLGQDATEEGRTQGTQMSLFDVSNLADPTRLSQVGFGEGASSTAEYDHHAFLWWDPADLVVVPLQVWSYDDATGRSDNFAGAVLVRNTGDRLEEVARISHTPTGVDTRNGFAEDLVYYGGIDRSLVIGNRLITISQIGIAAHDLATFEQLAAANFPSFGELYAKGGSIGGPEVLPVEPDGGSGASE